MVHRKKTRMPKRGRKTQNWLFSIVVIILIIIVVAAAYVEFPKTKSSSENTLTQPTQPSGLTTSTNHYLDLMKNLNSPQTKTEMAGYLKPSYNQTDLFNWEKSKMTFAQDNTGWYEDPVQILNSHDGICMQWSIVYVSACLSLGYQSRFVVAINTATWTFIHTWAEDYYNGTWVHVDPSDAVWNNPSRYQSWGWGTFGTQVKVYAFEDGSYQDITATYAPR
jgi:transglutaminase-like putative cysteine protease